MLRFFLTFIVIQSVLFFLEMLNPVRAAFVIPYTEGIARVSAWLIHLFDDNILVQGVVIRSLSSGFAVSIESGCNGLEAIIILVAAIMAFPATWAYRFIGLALGVLTVLVLNFARIISLFYIGQWNREVFEFAHLYLWQVLIMLDVLVVFLVWVNRMPKVPEATHAG